MSGVLRGCYEDVMRKLQGSYEETAPMELDLSGLLHSSRRQTVVSSTGLNPLDNYTAMWSAHTPSSSKLVTCSTCSIWFGH